MGTGRGFAVVAGGVSEETGTCHPVLVGVATIVCTSSQLGFTSRPAADEPRVSPPPAPEMLHVPSHTRRPSGASKTRFVTFEIDSPFEQNGNPPPGQESPPTFFRGEPAPPTVPFASSRWTEVYET